MAKKVMIVDDSSSVRTVARMALRGEGLRGGRSRNGQEALASSTASAATWSSAT